jgi:transposase
MILMSQSECIEKEVGVSLSSIFKKLLGVEKTALKRVEFVEEKGEEIVLVFVELHKRGRCRCPKCKAKSPYYDAGTPNRRWRTLDMGPHKTFIVADEPRVCCKKHGVLAAQVPWARHKARCTRAFEHYTCWLAKHTNRTVTSKLLRIDWKSVGPIVERVVVDLEREVIGRFDDLTTIGIDETSHKKGHKYLTIVVNHANGDVIWVGKGYGKEVLQGFFDLLTEDQRAAVRLVTADGARWIAECVAANCPDAIRLMDPFHVVSWATEALDKVRTEEWNRARKQQKQTNNNQVKPKRGRPKTGEERPTDAAKEIKGTRWALLKNPENLTQSQQLKFDTVIRKSPVMWRAYNLKEDLRAIFQMGIEEAAQALDKWLVWAARCRIAPFVELSKKVRRHKEAILGSIRHGLTNARLEAVNTKVKLTIRMGYGFRNVDNLIALVMLRCTSLPIALPGRAAVA